MAPLGRAAPRCQRLGALLILLMLQAADASRMNAPDGHGSEEDAATTSGSGSSLDSRFWWNWFRERLLGPSSDHDERGSAVEDGGNVQPAEGNWLHWFFHGTCYETDIYTVEDIARSRAWSGVEITILLGRCPPGLDSLEAIYGMEPCSRNLRPEIHWYHNGICHHTRYYSMSEVLVSQDWFNKHIGFKEGLCPASERASDVICLRPHEIPWFPVLRSQVVDSCTKPCPNDDDIIDLQPLKGRRVVQSVLLAQGKACYDLDNLAYQVARHPVDPLSRQPYSLEDFRADLESGSACTAL